MPMTVEAFNAPIEMIKMIEPSRRSRLSALFLDAVRHLVAGALVAPGDRDLGARFGKPLRDRPTDTARRARDDRHLPRQIKQFHLQPLGTRRSTCSNWIGALASFDGS